MYLEYFIFNEHLTSKLLKNNNFTLNLLNRSIKQLRKYQGTIINLSSNSASKRILFQILNISTYDQEKKIRVLHNKISQNHIASFSSVSRETVSREINIFKELGILNSDENKNLLINEIKAQNFLDK